MSTLSDSFTPRCTERNGTYLCQLPVGHKTLHKVIRHEFNSANELVATKAFTWIDGYSTVHERLLRRKAGSR